MKKFLCFIAPLFAASIAQAEKDVNYDAMCDKMTSCAVEQMEKQGDVPPEMIQMAVSMFASQCDTLLAPYTRQIDEADLNEKANACIDSFMSMSCDELMQQEGEVETQACKEFEQAADAAGLDLENAE